MSAQRLRPWLPVLLTLGMAAAATAQEKVATISTVKGEVKVTRAGDGRVDLAEQRGPRVTNSSVFPGDIVATGAGSSSTVVFSDGSTLELKESSKLTVQEIDLKALQSAGRAQKPIGRRIRVLAGDVVANVIPNAQIATEFETPSGVAAVKGTTLSISVSRSGAK